jgi:multidrug efflux pump subunit AcrA (membrane-fusion protein)
MSWIKKYKKLFALLCLMLIITLTFCLYKKKQPQENLSAPLKKGSIIECVYGIGTVKANKSYQLKSGIASKINNIFVKEGDLVKKGDKLIEMETTFLAPFDGTVTSILYPVGETIFPQSNILQIVDLSDRYIIVTLDQNGILHIKKGQKTKLNFDGMRDNSFEGIVTAIYPNNNQFIVRIDIPNLPQQILPGMASDISIEISTHDNVLLVPLAAIDKSTVLVKTGKKIKTLPITLGLNDGIMAEVTSSELKEGDRLILPTIK